LKYVKTFTNRPITLQGQSDQPSSEPVITPLIRVQQGIHIIDLPIDKSQRAKELINKLDTNIPLLHIYKINLEAFINWQQAEICLKQREIRTLRNAAINRKPRSKKTVKLKIIDTNTYAAWCEEMANKPRKRRIRSRLRSLPNRKDNSNLKRKITGEKRLARYQRMMKMITDWEEILIY
jgi:hypothetical protein